MNGCCLFAPYLTDVLSLMWVFRAIEMQWTASEDARVNFQAQYSTQNIDVKKNDNSIE